jgi:hypothetical protein
VLDSMYAAKKTVKERKKANMRNDKGNEKRGKRSLRNRPNERMACIAAASREKPITPRAVSGCRRIRIGYTS